MDIQTIELSVKKLKRTLYMSRYPSPGVVLDVPGFDEKMKRLNAFLRRVQAHIKWLNGRRRAQEHAEKMRLPLSLVRDGIAAGKTFMAFDVERSRENVTKEVGVTLWKDGVFRSFNYRIEGSPFKFKQRFRFGKTTMVTAEELASILIAHGETADFYIGHSLAIDLEHLKSKGIDMPFRSVVDTFWLAGGWPEIFGEEGNRRLEDLARHFGITADRPHNGGNDARYTMEVLLAMVENL